MAKSGVVRALLSLVLLLCCGTSTLAQGGLSIVPVTVTISSGQQTVGLRTNADGHLFVNTGGEWKAVGILSPEGELYTRPEAPSLELDNEGYFVSDGDTTPLRLEDSGTVSMDRLEIFRVQTSTLVEIEPIGHAVHRNITGVRIQAPPGGDKLAAYLIAVYILMM